MPMRTDTAADRLRRIADRAATGHPLDQDGAWLAACLREYLDNAPAGTTLDRALGLAAGRGQEPWWKVEARARRDRYLRLLYRRHFDALEGMPAALAMVRAVTEYELTRWPTDRVLDDAPDEYMGTPEEIIFAAFKEDAGMPRSSRQMFDVIYGS